MAVSFEEPDHKSKGNSSTKNRREQADKERTERVQSRIDLEDLAIYSAVFRDKILFKSGGWLFEVAHALARMTYIYETIWTGLIAAGSWIVLRTSYPETSMILGLGFDLTIPLQYYPHPKPHGQRTHLDEYWPILAVATALEAACFIAIEPALFTLIVCLKTLATTTIWLGSSDRVFWTAYVSGKERWPSASSTSSFFQAREEQEPSTSDMKKTAAKPSEGPTAPIGGSDVVRREAPPETPPPTGKQTVATRPKHGQRYPEKAKVKTPPSGSTLKAWKRELLDNGYADVPALDHMVTELSHRRQNLGNKSAEDKLDSWISRDKAWKKRTIEEWEDVKNKSNKSPVPHSGPRSESQREKEKRQQARRDGGSDESRKPS